MKTASQRCGTSSWLSIENEAPLTCSLQSEWRYGSRSAEILMAGIHGWIIFHLAPLWRASESLQVFLKHNCLASPTEYLTSAVLGEAWEFTFWNGCQAMTLTLLPQDKCVWTTGTHKRRSEAQRQSVWSLFPSLLKIKQHPSRFLKINLGKCLCVWVWAGAMAWGPRSEENLTSDLS